MSLDVMKQALAALEWNLPVIEDYGDHEQLGRQHRAITALRAAIEQAREWQGLTDDEMEGLYQMATYMDETDYIHMLMMAEAKLREKNT